MTGALILLAVLVFWAVRIRPRKHVIKKPDGSAYIFPDKKPWGYSPDDNPEDQPDDRT